MSDVPTVEYPAKHDILKSGIKKVGQDGDDVLLDHGNGIIIGPERVHSAPEIVGIDPNAIGKHAAEASAG